VGDVYFGQFLENYRSSQHFGDISTVKVLNNFDKKSVGLHFGRIFQNSSGHPACMDVNDCDSNNENDKNQYRTG
jgi:hypothetical protein